MKNNLTNLSPRQDSSLQQPTLFRLKLAEFESAVKISATDMLQWHLNGFLSFNPYKETDFDECHRIEVEFLAGLMRSGLDDEKIDKMLAQLPKPYCYNPQDTFYSFAHDSWITLPVPDPEEVIEKYLSDLFDDEDWNNIKW